MKKIAIIGSYNQDLVFRAHRIPAEGETVQGIGFFSNSGGKGSNQMISAHLQGADITPVLKLGNDPYGQQARALYKRLGMPLAGLLQDPNEPTGMAGIFTGENGSNSIVVTGGANLTLTADEMVDAVPQGTALIGFQLKTIRRPYSRRSAGCTGRVQRYCWILRLLPSCRTGCILP